MVNAYDIVPTRGLTNRDAVGARNILRCLTSDERPKSLVRVQGSGRPDLKTFDYWSKENGSH